MLVAIGSERYMPFHENPRPQELLTQANAILGQGQMSLAKYVWMRMRVTIRNLDTHDLVAFFRHMLERVDCGAICISNVYGRSTRWITQAMA